MAATDDLTLEFRRQTLALRSVTLRDLQRLWPALNVRDLEGTFPAWLTGASALVLRDRRRAAGLAARYLEAHRMAAGIPGAPEVRLAPQIDPERLSTSLRVTSLVAMRRGLGAGYPPEKAKANAFVLASGAAARHVLDGARETVRLTIVADPDTKGWQRVTSGNACGFCVMLAGRGAVYSAETADFASHDHCSCAASPVYGDDSRPVKAYTPSQKPRSDRTRAKDNARARAFIRDNDLGR